MKRKTILASLAVATLLSSCGTVPITGRRTLNLVSDSEVLAMSQSQYSGFVSQARSQGVLTQDARVNEVSRRLISATNVFLRDNNMTDLIEQMSWEVNVVNSDQVNAFCMPGGKIVVYTGLLKLIGQGVGSDAELAAVLGHEIAHALARHSSERLSNAMLQSLGGQLLGAAVGNKSQTLQMVINQAYGLGSNVFVALPFGRKQEYEADKMGMVLMALAGYNPNYAISLWQKMASNSGGGNSNDFLSTHPSEEKRIKEIQAYMPTAMQSFKQVAPVSTPPSSKATTKKTSAKKTSMQKTTTRRR